MENGNIGVGTTEKIENNRIFKADNVICVDAMPDGTVEYPPFTIAPFRSEEGTLREYKISFDEGYDGDISVKICSLMAEDFNVRIDGEEYSFAVRGAKQTDPGYAMIAGPFEKGSVITFGWGKAFAGVYMQEDVESVEASENATDNEPQGVSIPFLITGAERVLASKSIETVLVDLTGKSDAYISPFEEVGLEVDNEPVKEKMRLEAPLEFVYECLSVKAGNKKYELVLRNSDNKNGDDDRGPDAFMNVTGSFAGELCYKVGASEGHETKGTYHSCSDHIYGIDPYTGYFWGRKNASGSVWGFQVEEGLYEINLSISKGATSFVITSQDKEKSYPIPEDLINDDGPACMTVRVRLKNGIMIVRSIDGEGKDQIIENIEIRTLTTTAHASDYVTAVMREDAIRDIISEEEPEPEPVEEVTEEECEPEPVEEVTEEEPEPEPVEALTEEEPTESVKIPDSLMEKIVIQTIEGRQAEGEEADPESEGGNNAKPVLTEKEYRSAIENYFGPRKHGIDFWDSERKDRPAEVSEEVPQEKTGKKAGEVPQEKTGEITEEVPQEKPEEKAGENNNGFEPKIKVSVYSSSERKRASRHSADRRSGFLSSIFGKKKR